MAKKYYAVARGKTPGIYYSWDDCKMQIEHVSNATYKSFPTIEEADAFIKRYGIDSTNATKSPRHELDAKSTDRHLVAYVDGSFENTQKKYAYGCVFVLPNKEEKISGSGNNIELVGMRNVAGEILGSEAAIKWAIQHGYQSITIYYDYEGIEKWANGIWKANKTGTKQYQTFIEDKRKEIDIYFQKVDAHSGIQYNELADQLAKTALGL